MKKRIDQFYVAVIHIHMNAYYYVPRLPQSLLFNVYLQQIHIIFTIVNCSLGCLHTTHCFSVNNNLVFIFYMFLMILGKGVVQKYRFEMRI